jgi:protein arginine kinase activator
MREICEGCGTREASLRFTEVDGSGRRAALLCAACGIARGIPAEELRGGRMDTRELWSEILHRLADDHNESEALACPDCGLTFADFEAGEHLGCPRCYQTFMGDMTRLLREYHGSEAHRGKMPRNFGRRIDLRRRILGVKESIQLAVGGERFEEAARLRDEMRDLELELGRLLEAGDGA